MHCGFGVVMLLVPDSAELEAGYTPVKINKAMVKRIKQYIELHGKAEGIENITTFVRNAIDEKLKSKGT
jgi:hypothetical protein